MKNTVTPAKTLDNGIKVKIAIRNKRGYTSDLYSSIQGRIGVVVRKMELASSSYENAYLIEFNEADTIYYYENTHNGKWSGSTEKNMTWWTERKDFKIIHETKNS